MKSLGLRLGFYKGPDRFGRFCKLEVTKSEALWYLIQPPCISRLVSFDQLHREFTQSHGNLSENVRILHKPWFTNFNMNRTNLICKVNNDSRTTTAKKRKEEKTEGNKSNSLGHLWKLGSFFHFIMWGTFQLLSRETSEKKWKQFPDLTEWKLFK